MKKLIVLGICFLCPYLLYSQGFVYTTDGKMYFTEARSIKDVISVESEGYSKMIPKSDIVLIEYMEGGIDILQKDKLKVTEPKAFEGNFETFLAKGQKVYVPVSSTSLRNRWGAKCLRELLIADSFWQMVGCAEEADFILMYKFNDSGHDHANLFIYDRTDKEVLVTPKVSASDWIPIHAGEESAEKLYKKYIKKGIQKGSIKRK